MTDENSPQSSAPHSTAASVIPAVRDSKPLYFPVSLTKFVVMHFCTLGMYQALWFYRNWQLIQEREQSHESPFWRTAFAFIYCFPLFEKIRSSAASLQIDHSIAVPALATGWVLFSLFSLLPEPYGLAAFLSILFLLPIQQAANRINESLVPGHDRNEQFTTWNKVGVVFGSLLFIVVVIGMFVPRK